jgi:hypothetical protein
LWYIRNILALLRKARIRKARLSCARVSLVGLPYAVVLSKATLF